MEANTLCRRLQVIPIVAVLSALASPIAGMAGPTYSPPKPFHHDMRQGGAQVACPSSKALENFLVASNVGASFTNSDTTTTYSFFSLTNENPVDGVPGLIKYCVYSTPASEPTEVSVQAVGANGQPWISDVSNGVFSFERQDGNPNNIPLNGESTVMGTATWDSVPSEQVILLHINDPEVCTDLYGKQDDHDEYGKQDEHDEYEIQDEHDKYGKYDKYSKYSKYSKYGEYDQYGKKHGKDKKHKKDKNKRVKTCFVKPKPVEKPVCDRGDTSLAYNPMPFNAVNCNNPSLGFEATQTNEFGDRVQLAGTARNLVSLQVLFASFACQSGQWNTGDCVTTPGATFTHPVTANIYAVDNSGPTPQPGALLATVTQDVTFPYRPSADPVNCPDPAQFFNPDADPVLVPNQCESSKKTVITFNNFVPPGVTLPDEVIWSVAFNTTHFGYDPIGEAAACFGTSGGCPYDSLNVGAKSHINAPYAGIDVLEDEAYRSTPLPTSPFVRELGWTGNRPEGAIKTQ